MPTEIDRAGAYVLSDIPGEYFQRFTQVLYAVTWEELDAVG